MAWRTRCSRKAPSDNAWNKDGIQQFGVGDVAEVVLLTDKNDPQTETLLQPVKNDKKSKSEKPFAFTMWQCYVMLSKLKKARTTSALR